MADDNGDEEETGPAVELGSGDPVAGAPIARVASRLTWPQEKSEVRRKEGDQVIRTADGPRTLADLLEETDVVYFTRRQEFVGAVRDVTGLGPVPTE